MSDNYKYNPYVLGKVPQEKQRPELEKIKTLGYNFENPWEVVDIFERKIANFAGCKYVALVDCCTHGLFLSLKYLQNIGEIGEKTKITLPTRTYISVPMQLAHLNIDFDFKDYGWSGLYQLSPSRVYDSAVRWTKGMYVGDNALQVLSFQIKKRIPIGRGGAILTDDKEAYKAIKLMSYDGRDLRLPYDHPEHVKTMGYHMYMTPEDAARGILLMDSTPEINEDTCDSTNYIDVQETMNRIND